MRRDVDELQGRTFDVVVVGGGMHGAWIAMRAARAGYGVALIEKNDFGAATSANSLKILHGGLRYLQHLDFKRMRSSIRARRELGRTSPHLVQPLPCMMPLTAAGIRSPWVLGPALLINDLVSWDRNSGVAPAARLPRGRLIGARACRARIESLAEVGALAGALWWDAMTLDAGRLTLEPVLRAAAAGAIVANRVEALALATHGGVVRAVEALDCKSARTFEISTRVVIDATGPWAGTLSVASGLESSFLPPGWVGGLNLVLRRSLGIDVAVALTASSPSADRSAVLKRASRELFLVPWRGVTMVGTDYHAVPDRELAREGPPAGAVAKFLADVAQVAPRADLADSDVAVVHWGLLPLESAENPVPRKSPIIAVSAEQTGADGFAIVIGEKLTSAPIVSERVMTYLAAQLPRPSLRAPQQRHAAGYREPNVAAQELAARRLAARYGADWPAVRAHAATRAALLTPLDPSVEVLRVEVVHAVREEMALGLEDLVLRRLGLGEAGHPGIDLLKRCAEIAAPEWGIDSAALAREVSTLDARLHRRARR